MKIYLTKILVLILIMILSACNSVNTNFYRINIVGSDTMYYLTIRLAAEYMKLHPETAIYVKGGGSSNGFLALQNSLADICMSSRSIRSDEVKTIAQKYSSVGMSYLIAKDALSVYVNRDNKVNDLSINQIHEIFTCQKINWSEMGGENDSIITVNRTPQSGTYEYFKSHILDDDDICDNSLLINSTESVLSTIIKNKNAIGYGGIAFQDGIKLLKINGINPTEINVRNDSYPIIRYLYFYTVKSPNGEVKKFIDWVMSPVGQSIINKFGFISIWNN